MRIEGLQTPAAMRLFEALLQSKGFKCCACEVIYGAETHEEMRKLCAYVTAYRPRSDIMKKRVPPENGAAYVICVECSREPERTVFLKAEQHLIRNAGLLQTGHKSLDEPGSHRGKKKKPLITQGTRFKFGEGK